MNDQELFDLCREVYEKTGWDDTVDIYGEFMRYTVGTGGIERYRRAEADDAEFDFIFLYVIHSFIAFL